MREKATILVIAVVAFYSFESFLVMNLPIEIFFPRTVVPNFFHV